MRAVVQALAFFEWYSVKSQQEGLKLDLLRVPIGQWGAFFLLVFLGQVCSLAIVHTTLTHRAWKFRSQVMNCAPLFAASLILIYQARLEIVTGLNAACRF